MTKKQKNNNSCANETSNNPGQPEPLSGSHKVKNRNHSRQKHNSHHGM